MHEKINAGIIGGSGFTGMELVKILDNHPEVNINFVTSRTFKDRLISEAFPSYYDKGNKNYKFIEKASAKLLKEANYLFICLPGLESMEFLKKINKKCDFKIIDLGSDFRLKDPVNFKRWYGADHLLPEMLPEFVYGLTELNREQIKNSKYIANPGCYPTSVLLGLAPILTGNYPVDFINIDSKSGVTGAGRKLNDLYMFSNLNNNFFAYNTEKHRHIGEIEQEIERLYKKEIKICFTPHLLPLNRGIFSSIYCKFENEFDMKEKENEVIKLYQKFYSNSYFVRFIGKSIPQLKDVTGTNYCQIGFTIDNRTGILKIFSIIDNLLKGAAGQAVQNMNIMEGLRENEGLEFDGIFS